MLLFSRSVRSAYLSRQSSHRIISHQLLLAAAISFMSNKFRLFKIEPTQVVVTAATVAAVERLRAQCAAEEAEDAARGCTVTEEEAFAVVAGAVFSTGDRYK